MIMNYRKNLSILGIILNFIFFGTLIITRADSAPKLSQTTPMKNVVIDGLINETEWADRDWTIFFFWMLMMLGIPQIKMELIIYI